MNEWNTVTILGLTIFGIFFLQYLVNRRPTIFAPEGTPSPVADRISLLEQRVEELEGRQEFLVSELQKAGMKNMELQRQLDVSTRNQPQTEISPVLVVIGSDAALKLDLTAMRAVQSETGMEFRRITDATFPVVKQYLDRARLNGHPYDKMHLAVRADHHGLILSGQVVDNIQFSEILKDVKILLIVGCAGSFIGDYLGVVPYVVTISETTSQADTAFFCRAFWTQIGKGKDATEALRSALRSAPSSMSEYVENHW